MTSATLPETASQINTPEIDGLERSPEAEPISGEGSIMIVMGLRGITSIQILAEDSATEECLRECLMAARPILERLHEALTVCLLQGPCTR